MDVVHAVTLFDKGIDNLLERTGGDCSGRILQRHDHMLVGCAVSEPLSALIPYLTCDAVPAAYRLSQDLRGVPAEFLEENFFRDIEQDTVNRLEDKSGIEDVLELDKTESRRMVLLLFLGKTRLHVLPAALRRGETVVSVSHSEQKRVRGIQGGI